MIAAILAQASLCFTLLLAATAGFSFPLCSPSLSSATDTFFSPLLPLSLLPLLLLPLPSPLLSPLLLPLLVLKTMAGTSRSTTAWLRRRRTWLGRPATLADPWRPSRMRWPMLCIYRTVGAFGATVGSTWPCTFADPMTYYQIALSLLLILFLLVVLL